MPSIAFDKAKSWIEQASAVAVLTGAGISAESGIPTFRGTAGLWKQFRPEELATPEAFARDPKLVWEWYGWRRDLISRAQPNAGHRALAELETRVPEFTLITQNVDGLHQLAGSKQVLEVHGSIWTLRCTRCHRSWVDRTVPVGYPPLCTCGSMARPGVVWFGEELPQTVWSRAEQAVRKSDVLLVVGTSAVVYPAAGLAELARSNRAKIVVVNPEETTLSSVADSSLTGTAGDLLPALLDSPPR